MGERSFDFALDGQKIHEASLLDGVYVLETTLSTAAMKAEEVQKTHKALRVVEDAFKTLKSSLEIHPPYHWKSSRVKAHVSMCMLAYMVQRRLELALEGLGDEERPEWSKVRSLFQEGAVAKPHSRAFQSMGMPERLQRHAAQ